MFLAVLLINGAKEGKLIAGKGEIRLYSECARKGP